MSSEHRAARPFEVEINAGQHRVPQLIAEIHEASSALDDVLSELMGRLSAYRRPTESAEDAAKPMLAAAQSAHADELTHIRDKIGRQVMTLREQLDVLDL